MRTFEVVLDVDVDEDDTRTKADVRDLIWSALTRIANDDLHGAIVSIPVVRELRRGGIG